MLMIFLATMIVLAGLTYALFATDRVRWSKACYVLTGVFGCGYSLLAFTVMESGCSMHTKIYGNAIQQSWNPAFHGPDALTLGILSSSMILGIIALSMRAFERAAEAKHKQ